MELSASLAARSYGAARPLTAPDVAAQGGGSTAVRFADSFVDALQQAETQSRAAMIGDADPHALVAALSEAQLAVETTVMVRDKVVEAYLEILRMPV